MYYCQEQSRPQGSLLPVRSSPGGNSCCSHGNSCCGYATHRLPFSKPVFRPGEGHKTNIPYMFTKTEIIPSLPRLERQLKIYRSLRFLKINFEFAYHGFISYSFGASRQICSITPPLVDQKIHNARVDASYLYIFV